MMRLFDERERTDPSPATEEEDSFTFLDRVDTPYWGEVRRLLNEWFELYPPDHAATLRTSFRSKLPGQHWAAWWELYLYVLFSRLGYELTVHPELSDSQKTPDFELRRGDSRMYLEATVVFSGLESDRAGAPPWLLDAINAVDNGDFFVHLVEVTRAGSVQLKRAEVARPVQGWLDDLDPDEVTRGYEAQEGFPQWRFDRRGWELVFEAWPVKAESRGKAGHRVLGAGPVQSGWSNDIEQLRSKLKAKAGRYGSPNVPFVTAVLCMSAFMERLDIEQALFGHEAVAVSADGRSEGRLVRRRNGFWARGDGPQNRRVSGVLTAVGLHPWNAAKVAPELWLNPWANHCLDESWPFPQHTATERGEIAHQAAAPDMHTVLGLASDWPGGKPFPRE